MQPTAEQQNFHLQPPQNPPELRHWRTGAWVLRCSVGPEGLQLRQQTESGEGGAKRDDSVFARETQEQSEHQKLHLINGVRFLPPRHRILTWARGDMAGVVK